VTVSFGAHGAIVDGAAIALSASPRSVAGLVIEAAAALYALYLVVEEALIFHVVVRLAGLDRVDQVVESVALQQSVLAVGDEPVGGRQEVIGAGYDARGQRRQRGLDQAVIELAPVPRWRSFGEAERVGDGPFLVDVVHDVEIAHLVVASRTVDRLIMYTNT